MVVAKIVRLATGRRSLSAGGFYSENTVRIAGPDGTGKPTFTALEILMNGRGPSMDHETFCVSAGSGTDFCKTARKPYDLVVTACLAYLASRYGWSVSSDGDATDWSPGTDLASEALGKPVPNPLIINQLNGAKS